MESQNNQREEVLKVLEILSSEGIDVSRIVPRKIIDDNRRCIYLSEVEDNRIDEIIKKYNLNPNLRIGGQIHTMRNHPELFDESQRERINKLGIKKQDSSLEVQINARKNRLEATIHILNCLKSEGIDIPYISRTTNKKFTKIIDIECPNIRRIIKDLDLVDDYNIGYAINLLIDAYYCDKDDYQFGLVERSFIKELGLVQTPEETILETLDILIKLKKFGINIKKIDMNTKYLCDLSDKDIGLAIEQLGLQKYCLIWLRMYKLKKAPTSNSFSQNFKQMIKGKMTKLGLFRNSKDMDIDKIFQILEKLDSIEIESTKIPVHICENNIERIRLISDLKIIDLDEFLEELEIDESYPIGLAVRKIMRIYNSDINDYDLTEEQKSKIQNYGNLRNDENQRISVSKLIKLVKKLKEYGIDIATCKLSIKKGDKSQFLLLEDLPLTNKQLNEILDEFELKRNFNIGTRITNIKQALSGKNRLSISEEEKIELDRLGIARQKNYSTIQKIDFFEKLLEFDIDLSKIRATYMFEGKIQNTRLSSLHLTNEQLIIINELFHINEDFEIGKWITSLKNIYNKNNTDKRIKSRIHSLGIITTLNRLEAEQNELQDTLLELEQIKEAITNNDILKEGESKKLVWKK